MLHWDKIQVGDIVEWNSTDSPQYQIVSKTKEGTGWLRSFASRRMRPPCRRAVRK